MKRIVWTVSAILALIALVLLVLQSQSPSLPAIYQGISLPTSAPVGDAQVPPIWLIIQGRAISGTLLRFNLSNGQEFGTHGDSHLEGIEFATATFLADEKVVIIGTKSITGIQVKIVNDPPMYSNGSSLRADGKMEGDTAVFTFEPPEYINSQFLRVSVDFKEGKTLGNVIYTWRLIPATGSASFTPTPVSSIGTPPLCDILPNPAPTLPVLPTVPPDLIYIRSPEEMTREADLIILGTVVGPTVGHFDPPLGNSEKWASPDIVSDTALQVECVLKGTSPGATIMVRTEGGCVGETCLGVSGGVQIQLGQRAIMFLLDRGLDYVTLLNPAKVYEVQADYEYYEFGDYLDIAGDRIVSDYYNLTVEELLSIIQNIIR